MVEFSELEKLKIKHARKLCLEVVTADDKLKCLIAERDAVETAPTLKGVKYGSIKVKTTKTNGQEELIKLIDRKEYLQSKVEEAYVIYLEKSGYLHQVLKDFEQNTPLLSKDYGLSNYLMEVYILRRYPNALKSLNKQHKQALLAIYNYLPIQYKMKKETSPYELI